MSEEIKIDFTECEKKVLRTIGYYLGEVIRNYKIEGYTEESLRIHLTKAIVKLKNGQLVSGCEIDNINEETSKIRVELSYWFTEVKDPYKVARFTSFVM